MCRVEENKWSIYVVECSDKQLYCGISTDVVRRVTEHNHDDRRSAKFTRGRRPVRLVYHIPVGDHSSALSAERKFKRLSRPEKRAVIH